VACFDLQTGTRRWRQLVCAAQSASPGIGDNSLNLLTLAGDNIFINTNLGAVASLDTADGHVRWLAHYPRNRAFAVTEGLRQNFNPAIYDGGMLYVAPSDFRGILALDAFSGQLRWDSDHEHEVAELLGISGGKLWASNQRLWALDARSGKVEYHSGGGSDNPRTPVGHGRGLLAGGKVYWPVRVGKADDKKNSDFQIRVFDSQSTQELPPLGLKTIKPPCESGNLLMTKENVVIASPDQITLYLLTPET
jgi:outer membrane protein assembly factor BamB